MLIRKTKAFLYNIKYGIENLFKWIPIIWSDRDWDYDYLLRLLKFKLKSMSEYHLEYGNSENSTAKSSELFDCYLLLTDILEDDYSDKYVNLIKEKYGNTNRISVPSKHLGPLFHTIEWVKEDGSNRTEDELTDSLLYYKLAIQDKSDDLDKLFKIMNEKLLNWWD